MNFNLLVSIYKVLKFYYPNVSMTNFCIFDIFLPFFLKSLMIGFRWKGEMQEGI